VADQLPDPNSLQALMVAYRRSPEFNGLRPNSQRQYLRYQRHLEKVWHHPLRTVTLDFLLDIRDGIAGGYGPAAANCFVQAASALFVWAKKRQRLAVNPLAGIERLKGGSFPTWTMAQIRIALERFPEPLKRALLLGLHTGQRRSDLIAMTWSQFDGRLITLRQIKTGEHLTIPVHRELGVALEQWKSTANVLPHPAAPILTTTAGKRWSGTYLSMCFAAAVRTAGLPAGLNVHGLRKRAATRLAEAGCSVYEIQAITGHRDVRSLAPYVEKAEQSVLARAAMRRLEAGET
jgi:integrase